MVTNLEFLTALFGADASRVHVTDFSYDPFSIPPDKHLACWAGDSFGNYAMGGCANQYFTISIFNPDPYGKSRRRKSLYSHTSVIVLDDVKEKLSLTEVQKLPRPSYILLTSPGSEQWGYILNEPCHQRHRVENLLDGLVANGLAPQGKDPGMKGVTRYVRLPEGYNLKKSKMIDGVPFKCQLTEWHPERKVTLEHLAKPFQVDLSATRREARVDGAADVQDHPLLNYPDVLRVKEVRGPGRYDITCPWVEEHTGQDDSGTAIFTNADGSLGFKCHHGSCEGRNGGHLMNVMEDHIPGWKAEYKKWQTERAFKDLAEREIPGPAESTSIHDLIFKLSRMLPTDPYRATFCADLLQVVDNEPAIQQIELHNSISQIMGWNQRQLDRILKDLKQQREENKSTINFTDHIIYIAEQNQFYDRKKRLWFKPEAYQNYYAHLSENARKEALQGGRVTKVDKIDYAPKKAPVFEEDGVVYGNSWHDNGPPPGKPGDVTPWLNHMKVLGYTEDEIYHLTSWMAFTIQYPEQKINHMVILGSPEGAGKDWILYPLTAAMGDNGVSIGSDDLLRDFTEYLCNVKYLNVNEAQVSGARDAYNVSNKLKPLAAAPPLKLRINPKSVSPFSIRNIVNLSMTTNSRIPIRLDQESRRIFFLWSDLRTRNSFGDMILEWRDYWQKLWPWMKKDGYKYCIDYLNNMDVSNFNPGTPPPVTDSLRNMVSAGKSGLQQSVEAMVSNFSGVFEKDLFDTESAAVHLHMALTCRSPHVYYSKSPTPAQLTETFHRAGFMQIKAVNGTIWACRNLARYRTTPVEEIWKMYIAGMQDIKQQSKKAAELFGEADFLGGAANG